MDELQKFKNKLLEGDNCLVDKDRRLMVHKEYRFGACYMCNQVFTVRKRNFIVHNFIFCMLHVLCLINFVFDVL